MLLTNVFLFAVEVSAFLWVVQQETWQIKFEQKYSGPSSKEMEITRGETEHKRTAAQHKITAHVLG